MQLLITKTFTSIIHAEGEIKTNPNKPNLVPCHDTGSHQPLKGPTCTHLPRTSHKKTKNKLCKTNPIPKAPIPRGTPFHSQLGVILSEFTPKGRSKSKSLSRATSNGIFPPTMRNPAKQSQFLPWTSFQGPGILEKNRHSRMDREPCMKNKPNY